jgi:NADPH-dependent ferric siderophore reductase
MTATTQATRSRRRPPPLRATVSKRTQLSPHLVRVTVTGPALAGFNYPGPASHFKLILPAAGAGELTLPTPGDDGLVTLDSAPLTMRTYTARAFRPEVNEVDIDVFLHGDGPASTWAATAQPGDEIAVTSPRRSEFHVPESADWIVLAADGSAIPAVATILEVESRLPIRCIIELDDARDRVELPDQASASVHWQTRGTAAAPGSTLLSALRDGLATGPGFCWVAGESQAIRRAQTYLVADDRLNRDSVVTRGYWRMGAVNHPDYDNGTDPVESF